MKHTIGVLFAVFVLVLAGIGAWYWVETGRSDSEAADMDRMKEQARLVPVNFVVKTPPETPAVSPKATASRASEESAVTSSSFVCRDSTEI